MRRLSLISLIVLNRFIHINKSFSLYYVSLLGIIRAKFLSLHISFDFLLRESDTYNKSNFKHRNLKTFFTRDQK